MVGSVKNLAQNGGAVGGWRIEQPGKVVLRQHGHLGKLPGVNAQQLGDGGGHGGGTAHRLVRLTDEFRLGGAFHKAAATLGGPLLVRPAAHGVAAAPVGKGQLHVGFGFGRGKITAQHRGFAVLAGGLAVQGKGDGVKQGGLARAGVAADQKQAAAAKDRQVQVGAPGVGAKGVQGQVQGFHLEASSRRAFTARASSTVSGRPFIWVKKSSNSEAKGLPRTDCAVSAGKISAPWGR